MRAACVVGACHILMTAVLQEKADRTVRGDEVPCHVPVRVHDIALCAYARGDRDRVTGVRVDGEASPARGSGCWRGGSKDTQASYDGGEHCQRRAPAELTKAKRNRVPHDDLLS